jgi:serine/threonine-protein kinase
MLRTRQKFGKYVIECRLAEGGFANVYQARDTIEGVRVALKIPYSHLLTPETIECFRQEVRLAARLEHPNILPLKYADYIDGQLVIVTALGRMSLEERMQRRMSLATGLDFAMQMLSAVAYAHEHRIIHCDIKPDNFLIFADNRVRLTDFGIARVAQRTLRGSGTGTVGYVAPEQAMGQPSFRSDVFSLGIILYRMFSGELPEWPYRWPPVGYERLRLRLHAELIALIRRAVELDARKRFRDARHMLSALQRIRARAATRRRSKRRTGTPHTVSLDWQSLRRKEFHRRFGKQLDARYSCSACDGPVSEAMQACPWCGKSRRVHRGETTFPRLCPRCHRGLKADWLYCPWCYGAGFETNGSRRYGDLRYTARCDNPRCHRRQLMPFMRYCPWCRRRVRRRWKISGASDSCPRCGWGVLNGYWSHCPWCSKRLTP